MKSVSDLWSPKAFASGIGFSHDTNDAIAPVLLSDPTRISQILFNFMSNALKYTEAGSIKMTVSQENLADNCIQTRFVVPDSDAGIPPRLCPRFSRNLRKPTRPSRESTAVPALVLPSVNS
ncbi:MAG: ATP-binding protein [Alphaproteobacteria bacterium]|nr:ATP-binding protein [Alphaproteobacteria bacterium]